MNTNVTPKWIRITISVGMSREDIQYTIIGISVQIEYSSLFFLKVSFKLEINVVTSKQNSTILFKLSVANVSSLNSKIQW